MTGSGDAMIQAQSATDRLRGESEGLEEGLGIEVGLNRALV